MKPANHVALRSLKSLRSLRTLETLKTFMALAVFVVSSLPVLAQSEKFDYIFQEAVRQKQAGNIDMAFDLYDYCLRLNPNSGAVLYELSTMYNMTRQDSTAIKYLEKACQLYPDNYWYKQRLVMQYFRTRRNDDALVVVEDMAQRFPKKTDVLMMLLDLYEQNQDYAKMIGVLDKIEVKEGKSEQLSMEKFKIYLRLEDEEKAFAEMADLAKEYPNDLRYQVVLADLYADADKKEEAMRMYKSIEEKDPQNVTLLLSLSRYYQSEGPDSLYQQYLTRLITHPKLDTPTRTRMLASLVYENLGKENADSTALLTLFDKVLEQPQESTDIIEMKVRYMVTKDMPEEEIKPLLNQMLAIDPENDMARQQLLHYAIQADDADAIIDVCKPAAEYKSPEPVYYYYLGVAYIRQEKDSDALTSFRQCLERVDEAGENRVTMLVNTYTLLGDIYHKMNQDDKAYVAYDSVLIYKPNDVLVLNNYAYYLSLHKKDLKRAEQMSKKAIELEPDNPTYLDTYAWVLFQMKRYDEAKEYIDRVQELIDPKELREDSDILEHIEQINKKATKK